MNPTISERLGRYRGSLTAAGLLAAFLAALAYLEVKPVDIVSSFPQFAVFFARKFLPPDFTNIAHYLPYAIQTVLFAVVGTYLSTLLALALGILMSEAANPFKPLRWLARAIASLMRNIPVLVWASLFVYAFGVGNIVGLLALTVSSLGFLARSYGESLTELSGRAGEALAATGASRAQILWHGLMPMFMPAFVNWTLYSFELNIRASTILGMVGAGGIGVQIQTAIRLFKYREALAIMIIVIAIVLITELMTNTIRSSIK
ncbi:phosphonate ABC transporter, permease protein PhnE [Bifidobacterium simiiventris]|uniref:phosphonate ABC transporter, permease protein PhnE n=1 Tax=Bifidobacterium simiiventris TaxID=2834434 RepID=UPI001C5751FA|nr:phosphonate ABC transporter, permease protein PhnE [Bifidobacterium simiiventris]MBW3077784.1 phosphonate ABC transporter, permease protein PhnE [Bifidobacterium simiiventris]